MVLTSSFMGSIVVWNVCGLGSRVKKRCVRNLGRKFSIDVLGILETKLENINDSIINSIWGRHARDWYAVPSLGLSGGFYVYGIQLLFVYLDVQLL